MIDFLNRYIKKDNLLQDYEFTEWVHSSEARKYANNFESVDYFIVYSIDKPKQKPWEYDEKPMLKIGCASGKGFGMADSSMSDKFRTKRRKGTTQPKDRLSDHLVIMEQGPYANQIRKNIGNLKAAWTPVFEKYGWGPKLMKNVWIAFGVPTSMPFRDSALFCEFMELIAINRHIVTFDGSAPLADLKYQSMSDKERRILIENKDIEIKKRMTRISNDDSYLNKITNNTNNFRKEAADLSGFMIGKSI